MLPSQNGNEVYFHSYIIPIDDPSRVGEARRLAFRLCAYFQWSEVRLGRVGIIVNELANNLLKYAVRGKVILRLFKQQEGEGLEVLSVDEGPGIREIGNVLVDGFTTGSTPGTGLGAVKRQSDIFDIYTLLNKGTTIVAGVYTQDVLQTASYRIGAISVPLAGEVVCGDAWAVREDPDGLSVIMVDGLGHGILANQAAVEAVNVFQAQKGMELGSLFLAVHDRLRSTRGGAVFLIEYRKGQDVKYTGAGNIRAATLSVLKSKVMLSQNGTAGVQIKGCRVFSQEWEEGVLILHSDGLLSRWDLSLYPGLLLRHPALVAATLHRDFSRGTDDATVVAIGRRK